MKMKRQERRRTGHYLVIVRRGDGRREYHGPMYAIGDAQCEASRRFVNDPSDKVQCIPWNKANVVSKRRAGK